MLVCDPATVTGWAIVVRVLITTHDGNQRSNYPPYVDTPHFLQRPSQENATSRDRGDSYPATQKRYTSRCTIAHSAVVRLQVICRASPYLARAILDKPQGHLPLLHGRYRTWEEVGAVGRGRGGVVLFH